MRATAVECGGVTAAILVDGVCDRAHAHQQPAATWPPASADWLCTASAQLDLGHWQSFAKLCRHVGPIGHGVEASRPGEVRIHIITIRKGCARALNCNASVV